MYVPEGIEKIARLIKETFDGESLEVAEMMYSRELVTLMSHMAIDMGGKEVPNIMPEILLKYINADDDLITNRFYTENYAAIKTIMNLISVKAGTRAFYARELAKNNDEDTRSIVEALSVGLLEGLTVIAFLAKGKEDAEIFDRKIKALTHMRIR